MSETTDFKKGAQEGKPNPPAPRPTEAPRHDGVKIKPASPPAPEPPKSGSG
jgi:hypothetical protein